MVTREQRKHHAPADSWRKADNTTVPVHSSRNLDTGNRQEYARWRLVRFNRGHAGTGVSHV